MICLDLLRLLTLSFTRAFSESAPGGNSPWPCRLDRLLALTGFGRGLGFGWSTSFLLGEKPCVLPLAFKFGLTALLLVALLRLSALDIVIAPGLCLLALLWVGLAVRSRQERSCVRARTLSASAA
jgi:hypothetical protein